MSARKKKSVSVAPIYTFAITWSVLALILPLYKLWALILDLVVSAFAAYLAKCGVKRKKVKKPARQIKAEKPKVEEKPVKKSYGPEIDPIIDESNKALSEMGRLYKSIEEPDIRAKINEIMRITDKIAQDAINDPSDIPQIKKFFNFYLPTTIKLLNAYDRMSSQGIEGENLDKSMKSIDEMLDSAIEAYKKRLDSLFANQALDIETDIEVMNTMLAREGLSGDKDFNIDQQSEERTN
ncbi:MAG: 5-bromo-4-chloroindolyl phosphate hydrolysis family protein [Candidatus Limivicinus sp.]